MILVVGATGMLGGAIVRRLVGRGEQVRALVRDAYGKAALGQAGAEPVWGDLKEAASLVAACKGVSTVVTTANSAGRGGDDNVETVDLNGNRYLIEAATEAGVEHFIFISAQGEHPTSPVPFLQAKGLASKLLRESGMGYTVLLPDIYMDVWTSAGRDECGRFGKTGDDRQRRHSPALLRSGRGRGRRRRRMCGQPCFGESRFLDRGPRRTIVAGDHLCLRAGERREAGGQKPGAQHHDAGIPGSRSRLDGRLGNLRFTEASLRRRSSEPLRSSTYDPRRILTSKNEGRLGRRRRRRWYSAGGLSRR